MTLTTLLSQKKALILDRWLQGIFESYPPETAVFLKKVGNRFDNPVGYRISQGIRSLLDAFLTDADIDQVRASLDEVIRIWAVQDFSPAQALAFIFLLKKLIRDELAAELKDARLSQECLDLESRIDGLALLGFEVFMKRREMLYEIRVTEFRARVSGLLRSKGVDLANL